MLGDISRLANALQRYCDGGADVLEIGLAKQKKCTHVTESACAGGGYSLHNPIDYNGMKIVIVPKPLSDDEFQY